MGKKNVSLVVSGAGWIGGFAEGLIKALREREISDEAIHSLVTEGGKLPIAKIADVLADFIWRMKKIFQIVVGGNRTTEEVIKAGKYDWVDPHIDSKSFPIESRRNDEVTIEIMEDSAFDLSSEEAIRDADIFRGLERPSYEDALFFGEQFPEEQKRRREIVFLHTPWRDSSINDYVLALLSTSRGRELRLFPFNSKWHHSVAFAFRKPNPTS